MNTNVNAAAILRPEWKQPESKEQLLQKWLDAAQVLNVAKASEMELRKRVVEAYPFAAEIDEGTQNLDLANGYKLKVVKKLTYTLNNKEQETDAALDKLESLGERGKLIAERLVKWSPALSVSEYRLLDGETKSIIDSVLTIKPGAPTLELVEPKTK